MEKINEIKLPEGVDRIAVKQHDDRIVIEFIPEKPKFKIGDKVRIKKGVTTGAFMCDGLTLTVSGYDTQGQNILYCKGFSYLFHEDWLEPWSDDPKVGDMVIAWNNHMGLAVIGIKIDANPAQGCKHVLNNNNSYKHAIKFESKEQFEKVLIGEI